MAESLGNSGAGRKVDLPLDPVGPLYQVPASERDPQHREQTREDASKSSFRARPREAKNESEPSVRDSDRVVLSEAAQQMTRCRQEAAKDAVGEKSDNPPPARDASIGSQGFREIV